MSNLTPPPAAIVERKARMWNTWARFSREKDGVITHVFEEGTERAAAGRAICGAPSYDGGGLNMKLDAYEPGCLRCKKLLRKWGLIEDRQANQTN